MKHILYRILWLLLVLACLPLPIAGESYVYHGEDSPPVGQAWEDFLQALPEEICREAERLQPENGDVEGLFDTLTISYWTDKLLPLLREGLTSGLRQLTSILSVLLLTALVRQWSGGATQTMFGFCSDLVMALTVFTASADLFGQMERFLGQLCSMMTALVPVMGAVSLGAGEAASASVNRIGLTLFITVLNQLQRWLFTPLAQALYSLSMVTAVCSKVPLGSFTASVKKLFMTLFSFMMLVYSFVYGMQNALAKGADSLGLRTVRFAMSSFIPMVGGTVADAFSAVREGMSAVRLLTGMGGIWVLALLVLPMAVSVWCFSLSLSVCHTTAELLDCGQSARLIGDTRSILQLLSALLWLSVTFFLFAIILFAKTAVHTV